MDSYNDELSAGYYSVPIVDQRKIVIPLYVFDIKVLHQHFQMDYTIPGKSAIVTVATTYTV